jgi:hypothetical protein
MEGPISFCGYKEQESNLILPGHDDYDYDDDDDDDDDEYLPFKNAYVVFIFFCYSASL